MRKLKLEIFNQSTKVTDDQVRAVIPSLQTQIHRDFAPVFGTDADLFFVPKDGKLSPDTWWIGLFDNSDHADAEGYHKTSRTGLPFGRIFIETDIKDGSSWTVTLSHELLETLSDPVSSLAAFVKTADNKRYIFAYEVCDPCQDDSNAYEIDGVLVSDFVYPSWFENYHAKGTRFDHRGLIHAPFFLLPGGYITAMGLVSGKHWHQLNAKTAAKGKQRKAKTSRSQDRLESRFALVSKSTKQSKRI